MNPSVQRPIGRTSLRVTQFGFGGAGMGSVFRKVDEADAQRAVAVAYDAGVRHFDTAPLYGYGLSEVRLGRALARYPRAEYVISTKVGYTLVPRNAAHAAARADFAETLPYGHVFDYSRDAVLRSLDSSMARLGTDRLDLAFIHDPDESLSILPDRDPYAQSHFREAMEGAYPALAELRAQGVIRALGVGMNQCPMLCDFALAGDFDCLLLAGRYTLLHQDALDRLLPLCLDRGISIMIGSPFQSGILATGATPDAKYNYVAAPPHVLERVRRIERVCAEFQVSLPAAALQFPFGHPAVISVLAGASSTREVEANLEYFREPIPAVFWRELERRGLIDPRTPLPS